MSTFRAARRTTRRESARSEPIQRAAAATVLDVDVPLRGADVAVSERAIHEEEVAALPIGERRKRVPERMHGHPVPDAGFRQPEREAILHAKGTPRSCSSRRTS